MDTKRYGVATSDTLTGLAERVSELIEQGWEPTGGVFVRKEVHREHGWAKVQMYYYQAMWRRPVPPL